MAGEGVGGAGGLELAAPVIFLLGPTASGKSRLAMAVARTTGAEICSVDAFQIYRGLDIGTAKPSAMARTEIRHHLLDLVEPEQPFTAADYLRSAGAVLEDLRKRSQGAIWVGGTGLYHKVLAEGLARAPGTDVKVAAELEARSTAELVEEIRRVDPEWSGQADLQNRRRLIRALAVWRQTARKMSSWQREETVAGPLAGAPTFALVPDLDVLAAVIRTRVAGMIQDGWAEEVRRLRGRAGWRGCPGGRAIGYREIELVVAGRLGREEASDKIMVATRAYAKRQLTWLKRVPNLMVIEGKPGQSLPATGVEKLAKALAG
ncbi:MAG: tRNA (adenosine(37)-N6)-dimethylallyltransferase MiaA [Verrucomicrobia bacterium]|nr:tRNA (adenosine(37)-N6)-dimethylallyltransferase MiaA [Verrucomicrobiota bacterium]